jgi:hypothetical protein
LSSNGFSLNDQRAQAFRRSIYGDRKPGRACPYDGHIAGSFLCAVRAQRVENLRIRWIYESVPVEEDEGRQAGAVEARPLEKFRPGLDPAT